MIGASVDFPTSPHWVSAGESVAFRPHFEPELVGHRIANIVLATIGIDIPRLTAIEVTQRWIGIASRAANGEVAQVDVGLGIENHCGRQLQPGSNPRRAARRPRTRETDQAPFVPQVFDRGQQQLPATSAPQSHVGQVGEVELSQYVRASTTSLPNAARRFDSQIAMIVPMCRRRPRSPRRSPSIRRSFRWCARLVVLAVAGHLCLAASAVSQQPPQLRFDAENRRFLGTGPGRGAQPTRVRAGVGRTPLRALGRRRSHALREL